MSRYSPIVAVEIPSYVLNALEEFARTHPRAAAWLLAVSNNRVNIYKGPKMRVELSTPISPEGPGSEIASGSSDSHIPPGARSEGVFYTAGHLSSPRRPDWSNAGEHILPSTRV